LDVTAIIIMVALLVIVLSVMGKMKWVTTILIFCGCFIVMFLVMAAVPALQVEPVYGMLRDLLSDLPRYLNDFVDYLKGMFGVLS
jgi:hypothetical protein